MGYQAGCDEWKDLEPHPDGVIALNKESMRPTVLSQRPIAVLPHCIASGKLVDKDLKPAERKCQSNQEKQQYLKDNHDDRARAVVFAQWGRHY